MRKKHVSINLALIVFLIQASIFSAFAITDIRAIDSFNPDLTSKFEPWLWEKVQKLEANGTDQLMTIVASVNCTTCQNRTVAYGFKNYVASLLVQNHNASILYIGKVLSFANVKIRVPEVKKIATYEFIDGLGDGEAEGEYCLDVSTGAIRSDFVVNELDYNGSGRAVSLLDTGIDPNHPDFTGKTIVWRDFVNGQPNPYDDEGHGTHCAGIAVGTGQASNGVYRGVAPGVETLIIGKTLNQFGDGTEADAIASLDWALSEGAQIISCSWGFQRRWGSSPWYCDGTCQVCAKANECVSNGVIVLAAAGNEGLPRTQFPLSPRAVTDDGYESLRCPGCASHVITVGATNDENTVSINDDEIAFFTPQQWPPHGWASSRGPNANGEIKPDVTAPGVNVFSPDPVGAAGYGPGDYWNFHGTSAATPHVAGVAALLLQAHPGWTPSMVKSVMMGTARLNDNLQSLTENDRGKGIVDAEREVLCATDIPVDQAESKYEYGYGDYTADAYLNGRYDLSAGTEHVDPPENYAITTLNKSFVPQNNLISPKFFFGFHDKGYMKTPYGWTDFRAIFKLYAPDGSPLFTLNSQIHYESGTAPRYFDDYHTIDYLYPSTLIAQQTYTIEYGFSTYAHQAYSDFDSIDRGAQALAITIVDLVGVGNPSFEQRLMLAPGVYGVPYWSMNDEGWRELRGDCSPPDGDGSVGLSDCVAISQAYGSTPGDPNWNPYADLNGDGVVGIADATMVSNDYGKIANRVDGSYSWYTSGNGTYNMDQWLCDHDVSALRGQQVTFSFWFKPDGIGNNATARIHYVTPTGQQTISGNWVYATEDWHSATVTTTLPANTVTIEVIIHLTDNFQTWIDKASIVTL